MKTTRMMRRKHHQWKCRNRHLRARSPLGDRRRTRTRSPPNSRARRARPQREPLMQISKRADRNHKDRDTVARSLRDRVVRNLTEEEGAVDRRALKAGTRTSKVVTNAKDKEKNLFFWSCRDQEVRIYRITGLNPPPECSQQSPMELLSEHVPPVFRTYCSRLSPDLLVSQHNQNDRSIDF